MIKNTLSFVAIIALSSSMSFGGGEFEPVVEPVVTVEEPAVGGFFIGLMAGYENVAVDTYINSVLLDDTDQDNLFIGLKLGYMFDFNHRVDIAAEKTNHSNGLVAIPISLNYTYVADTTVQNLHPFVGAGFGLINWTETILCGDFPSKEIDLDGTMWQVRAGLLYELNQETELEVYYRYSQATFDTEYCQEGATEVSIDLENVKRNGIFAGINYKF